jgi:hypothetical protein
LTAGSAAIDKGIPAGVPLDLDGQSGTPPPVIDVDAVLKLVIFIECLDTT